ncbi:hypothetical protein BGZ70_003536 [Mortierella alpina]|uniref:F-box domain-containing protein n=1 Tax=Mortierella alpina TaxID=64518 RepID=A0A9P6ISS2_MORAP|nr:hypothetical protein BGZ70_003536 [Mortierella alpina]
MYDGSPSFSDAYDSSPEDLAFEEAFYDPSDIHLEPRQLHKSKASKPKQRSQTKVLLPIRRTSRKHYVFPIEVLELVCSHLSQATLRCAVSLVCKEWSNASRRFIRRAGVWNNATAVQENQLLEQMPNLVTLECSLTGVVRPRDTMALDEPHSISWDRFKTAITAPLSASNKDQINDPTAPQCLLHYIRRLVLQGPQMTYEVSIPRILHQFHFLQSLHLHVQSTHIPLFKLLDRSPSLRELKVMGQKYQIAQLLSGDDEDLVPEKPEPVINPETAHFPRKPPVVIPPKAYPHRYKLRVFEIYNVFVKQRVLERVIATCQNLRVFKLHEINGIIWVPELSVSKHYPIDEDRLWNHLQNCCPKVEWYHLLHLATRSDDEMVALGRMHRNKALGRFMTTTCVWNLNDYLQNLEVRSYLKNITVLEVLPTSNFAPAAISLHRLLCLMPNLLHLIATKIIFRSTEVLELPGDATSTARKEFNYHNRGRKRQEREERRQQRQRALERFQGREHGRLSIPDVWQCRDLRTMAMDFGLSGNHFCTFTRYVEIHRLLRNLTSLSITIDALRVGQLKNLEAPPLRKFPKKMVPKSRSHARPRATQAVSAGSETQTAELLPPERWENELLMLRGLRCLETFDLKSYSIVGALHATDFEFLRKENHSHVMLFITDKNKDAGSDSEEDSPRNERCGRRKDRTFWPHLQYLRIRYHNTHTVTDFADVVAGLKHIRPGVEFEIKKSNAF